MSEINMNHNDRVKNYLLDADNDFFQHLGISNQDGSIKPSMYKKYKQISRFTELFDERISKTKAMEQKRVKVLDIGSGKGYLTFAIYQLLRQKQLNPKIDGVDLKSDMIELCNTIAEKSGFENLTFHNVHSDKFSSTYYDAVIALHACDTATDDALFHGIKNKSKLIFCAPCCQHEVSVSFKQSTAQVRKLTNSGLLLQKQSEIITDNARVLLLQSQGYDVDVIEFVASEHTQKNTLIAATKRRGKNKQRYDEYKEYVALFGISGIKLEKLLHKSGLI